MGSPTHFYIANGVRRAVAARDAGETDIAAILIVAGQTDREVRIGLDQLHSPKTTVSRYDSRYRAVVAARLRGITLPAIEVQPLGAPGQTAAVPLATVILV